MMKCMSLLKASCYEIDITSDGSWKQNYMGSLSKIQSYDAVTSRLPYENIEHSGDLNVTGAPVNAACVTLNLALFDSGSSGSTCRTIFVEGDSNDAVDRIDRLTQWCECSRPYMADRFNDRVIAQRNARPPHLRLIILTQTVTLISGMNAKDLISMHRYILVERDPNYPEIHCRSRKIRELCDQLDQSFVCGILLMIRERGTGFLGMIGAIREQFAEEVGREKADSLYRRIRSIITSINGHRPS